ncbi:MAG TPA: AI-2E family transporter, partial [Actinomycetales bacterium]
MSTDNDPAASGPAEHGTSRETELSADAADNRLQATGDTGATLYRPPGEGFGTPGRPLNRRSPFYIGFVGALGVFIAYGLVHALTMITSVLTLLVVALFLALGLDPVVQGLQARGLKRGSAVSIVLITVVAAFAGIIALVVPPVVTEAGELANNAPDLVDNLLRNPQLARLDEQYQVVTTLQTE